MVLELDVRAAGRSDVDDIVRVHSQAFPTSALTRLGPGAVHRYYCWQFDGPHDIVALLGTADGVVEGFCIGGTFRGALGGFLRTNRSYLAWRVLRQPWVVADPMFRDPLRQGWRSITRAGRRATATAPSGTADARSSTSTGTGRSFGILSIAVSPHRQGTGLAQALLVEAEHAARHHGYERAHLTVAPANTRAISFYERNGWRAVNTPGAWRGAMAKPLTSNGASPGGRTG